MAAAIASPATSPPAAFAADPYADRHSYHRPETRKPRGRGWLLWLLILIVIAGAGYYAWWSGQLDPWLKQYGLMPR